MAGTNSKVPPIGTEIKGKLGTYRVKDELGHGGNGIVFEVDVKCPKPSLAKCNSYVIKILNLEEIRTLKEREKRYKRFQEEIESVRKIQNDIAGIIPVLDTSFDMDEKNKFVWYLMPKASEYHYRNNSLKSKLLHMEQLALIIAELHKRGYKHRDIKPDNLLWYKGRVCLSDFGLVWNPWKDNLTEAKDNMGPVAIRPPELDGIDDIKGIDYTKSDVYLFAKTLWIILTEKRGFTGEYRRNEKEKYLNKELFHVHTLEPIHRMLEEATKHFWEDRISIDVCIDYIQEQLNVISANIPLNKLNELEFCEKARYSFETLDGDGKIYTKPQDILSLLERMKNVSEIVFDEYGVQYNVGELYKTEFLNEDQYLLKVKKMPILRDTNYIIVIKEVRIDINLNITIFTDIVTNSVRKGKIYNKLKEAVNAPETDIYISGNYHIILKTKGK